MKYWIAPSNDHMFRIAEALTANNGMVDWREDKFSIGDVVFMYKTKPEQCIRYKMEVVQTNLNADQILEQEAFWADLDTYYSGLYSSYSRLKLLEQYADDVLTLSGLHEHGYNGIPQSVRECKDTALIDWLLHPQKDTANDTCEVDYTAEDSRFYEGALVTVKANRYERNPKARQQCVDKKGYQCQVCGRDFEATYGEIGKNFIHVHHLTPISSIGKEYELNVDTDLVPVCPNCHYMLHRKEPPYTIEELRQIMHEAEEEQQSVIENLPTIPIYEEYKQGRIPLYSLRAACGRFEDDEYPEEEGWVDASGLGFTPDPKRYFAVHAKGNSMLPKIQDGDICIFEWYTAGSRDGEIVLMQTSDFDAEYDGRYTIKRYHSEKIAKDGTWEHSRIVLQPLNPDFEPIELEEDEAYYPIGIFKCVLR